jgi:SAM-dependent methyltransferase
MTATLDERLVRHDLGFLQVRHPPTAAELRDYYHNRYFQTDRGNYRRHYADDEVQWFRSQTARTVAAALKVSPMQPRRALDVGCGEGFALQWLLDQGWDAQGVDYTATGLDRCHPHLAARFRTGDVSETARWMRENERFDLLLVRNVLEHVLDPVGLLEQLKACIAPDGVCAVTVPNDGSPWQERLFATGALARRFWIAIPDHISYFTADSLRRLSEATGWVCRRVIAEFPIDWFLANPAANYVTDPSKGPGAHAARIAVDSVLSQQPMPRVLDLLESLAAVGMGRQLTAFLTPAP